MSQFLYPSGYSDEDKAIYDDLFSRGKNLIGSKINAQDEFLLDLSAKITINNLRGYSNNLTPEEITDIKEQYKDNLCGEHNTNPELFKDGKIYLQDGSSFENPFNKTEEECYKERMVDPNSNNLVDPNISIDTV